MDKIKIEDIRALNDQLPKQEGLRELKLISNEFVKKGIGMLILHPDDFELMKSILPPQPSTKEPDNDKE